MSLKELLAQLEVDWAALQEKVSVKAVHEFARTVNEIGYFGLGQLEKEKIEFKKLIDQVYDYYQRILAENPQDGAAINNMGVFISNNGNPSGARAYFTQALELIPDDLNVHENLRIADILTHKPKRKWHQAPAGLKAGPQTLAAFFDPQGM